jgi:hypothetical protein
MFKIATSATDGRLITVDADKDLAVDLDNLSGAMAEQPGKYAYYASLLAKAEHDTSQLEDQLQVIKDRFYASAEDVSKKWHLDAKLNDREDVKGLKTQLSVSKYRVSQLKVVVEALVQRRDMLRGLGHLQTRLVEQDRDLTVKGPSHLVQLMKAENRRG